MCGQIHDKAIKKLKKSLKHKFNQKLIDKQDLHKLIIMEKRFSLNDLCDSAKLNIIQVDMLKLLLKIDFEPILNRCMNVYKNFIRIDGTHLTEKEIHNIEIDLRKGLDSWCRYLYSIYEIFFRIGYPCDNIDKLEKSLLEQINECKLIRKARSLYL